MSPTVFLTTLAMPLIAWIAVAWIKSQRIQAVRRTGPDADRKMDLLSAENEKLTGRISRLEERIAVLERIATDPAARTARDIDALR